MPEDLPIYVYGPNRFARPRVRAYLRASWRLRRLILQLARADIKARHVDTVLGQVWAVMNPLLLAGIYYFIFGVIFAGARGNPDYLGTLLLMLFAFYFTRNAVTIGASSVVGGGALLTNTKTPRLLLPVSATASALLMYLPTFAVYGAFHLLTQKPIGPQLVVIPLLIAIHFLFNSGLALIASVATVYFRDAANFLPYLLRLALYVSPVVYSIEDVPAQYQTVMRFNPLYPILTLWREVVVEGRWPSPDLMGIAIAWAVVSLAIGLFVFLAKEHEFALRA